MTEASLIEFFKLNSEYFISNSIVSSAIRFVGWGIIKILTFIASGAENLYNKSFGLIDFTTWPKINQFIDAFKPLFVAIMAISIFALGIILIFHHEKKPKIIINICIAALCFTCSTVVFQQLNTIVKDVKTGIESVKVSDKEFNGVYDIISENLTDLVYLDHKYGMKNLNLSKETGKHATTHPNINKKNFGMIDYNEVLNYSSDDVYEWKSGGEAEEILKKKLVFIPDESKYKTRDVFNGFGWNSDGDADMANEFYYRYHFKFFNACCLLIAMIVIYITMSYKTFRIVWELVFSRLLAVLYSAELSGGQKVAKILVFIRDSYIALLMTVLSIRLFYLGYSFISSYTGSGFIQSIFILFLAFCVIDGPNLVEKLLGMDIGLGSALGRLIVAKNMMQSAFRAGTAPLRYASNRHKQNKMYEKMNGSQNSNNENTMNGSQNSELSNNPFNSERRGEEQEKKMEGNSQAEEGSFAEKEFSEEALKDSNDIADKKEGILNKEDPDDSFMNDNQSNGESDKNVNGENIGDKFDKDGNIDDSFMNVGKFNDDTIKNGTFLDDELSKSNDTKAMNSDNYQKSKDSVNNFETSNKFTNGGTKNGYMDSKQKQFNSEMHKKNTEMKNSILDKLKKGDK